MAVTSNVGGWIADTLVTRGVSVTTVRKVMQSVRVVLMSTGLRALWVFVATQNLLA